MISSGTNEHAAWLKVNDVVLFRGIIVQFLHVEVVFRVCGGLGMRLSVWLYGFYFLVESFLSFFFFFLNKK